VENFRLAIQNCCRVTWVSLSRSGWHEALPGDTLQHSTSALFVLRLYFLQSCILLRYAFTIGSFRTGFSGIIGRISLLVVLTVWTLLSILLLPFPSVAVALWPTIWGFQLRLTPSVFRPFRLEPMRQSSTRITGTRTSSPSQRCPSVTVSMPPHPRLSKISPGKKIPTPRPGRGNRRAPR